MRVLQHVLQSPFVLATALAALLHSVWSLGTVFAGEPPEVGLTAEYLGWLIPAVLVAVSLDIGLLTTSIEIKSGQRSVMKFITFIVLTAAMYYLQFIYVSSHTIVLPMGEGVSGEAIGAATFLRNASVWVIPALLPLAVTLHTFSSGKSAESNSEIISDASDSTAIVLREESDPINVTVPIACDSCNWNGTYADTKAANAALRAHKRHCPGVKVSANGRISDDSAVSIDL